MFYIVDYFPEALKGIKLLGRRYLEPISEVLFFRLSQGNDSVHFVHRCQVIKPSAIFQLHQV